MEEKTLFPREEKSEILFKKISEDKWACEKLMETFCSYLFSNDGVDLPDSPSSTEFAQALFNSYRNRDLSAFLMAICQNTVFDLLRNGIYRSRSSKEYFSGTGIPLQPFLYI